MSRRGKTVDNIIPETYFSRMKREMWHGMRNKYESVDAVYNAFEDYREYFTFKRIMLSLGGTTPHRYKNDYFCKKAML